jgi:adenylate kinase
MKKSQTDKIPISVVFIGPPGSGKGTTANFLQKEFNIIPVSPGNIFKNLRSEDSELSKLVVESTKNGGLCPDHLTNKVVSNEIQKILNKSDQHLSLDGYPRTLDQFYYLKENYDVSLFIHASTNWLKLKSMILNRRNCKHCKKVFSVKMKNLECNNTDQMFCALNSETNWEIRWDDNIELFEKRYKVYQQETLPIIKEISNNSNYLKLDLFQQDSYQIIKSALFGKI